MFGYFFSYGYVSFGLLPPPTPHRPHSVIASVRVVRVVITRSLVAARWPWRGRGAVVSHAEALFSSRRAADECDRGGDIADRDTGDVAAAARREGERPHRLLQAAVRGVGPRRLRGDRRAAQPHRVRTR